MVQGSVIAMRMWTRVLAQGHEVTAVVRGGVNDPDRVEWARVVRRGAGREEDLEVDIQVGMQFN